MVTGNNGFELPSDGASNAGESINTNFQNLDTGWRHTKVLGESASESHIMYVKNADKKAYKAIASATDTSYWVGALTEDGSANDSRTVIRYGRITNNAWDLNTESPVWLSDSVSGAVTQTEPTISRMIGIPDSASSILLGAMPS